MRWRFPVEAAPDCSRGAAAFAPQYARHPNTCPRQLQTCAAAAPIRAAAAPLDPRLTRRCEVWPHCARQEMDERAADALGAELSDGLGAGAVRSFSRTTT